MRIRLGLVTEKTKSSLNQAKLCLYSLRKNAGSLKDIPVTLITNGEALDYDEQSFFKNHFSPIDFKTAPRLGAIPHTSKLNVFYSIEPSSYDILFYLDHDTVIAKSLDDILNPILDEGAEFVCRRGGETDRNRFVNFNDLKNRFCGNNSNKKVKYGGKKEWPMFNTGVFLATSDTVKKIRRDSIDFTYSIFNEWQRIDAFEGLPILNRIYKSRIIKSHQKVLENWTIEQGAIALACIKSGVNVHYLDEIYNTWGPTEDLRILHCFKSAYKFDRNTMFSGESKEWIMKYLESDLPGKKFLGKIVTEYITDFNKLEDKQQINF